MPTINIVRKTYASLLPAVGPYSHAVKNGNTLYLSGFTAYGTDAQGQSMEKQADSILKQIAVVAAEEGTDLNSLIKVTVFITDFSQAGELRNVLAHHYDGHLPASSLVEVSRLFSPEVNIEIEAIIGL